MFYNHAYPVISDIMIKIFYLYWYTHTGTIFYVYDNKVNKAH